MPCHSVTWSIFGFKVRHIWNQILGDRAQRKKVNSILKGKKRWINTKTEIVRTNTFLRGTWKRREIRSWSFSMGLLGLSWSYRRAWRPAAQASWPEPRLRENSAPASGWDTNSPATWAMCRANYMVPEGFMAGKEMVWGRRGQHSPLGFWNKAMPSIAENHFPFEKQILACSWLLVETVCLMWVIEGPKVPLGSGCRQTHQDIRRSGHNSSAQGKQCVWGEAWTGLEQSSKFCKPDISQVFCFCSTKTTAHTMASWRRFSATAWWGKEKLMPGSWISQLNVLVQAKNGRQPWRRHSRVVWKTAIRAWIASQWTEIWREHLVINLTEGEVV